jgi:hypothetical protein
MASARRTRPCPASNARSAPEAARCMKPRRKNPRSATRIASLTEARLTFGATGTRARHRNPALRFALDHARAREAVMAELDVERVTGGSAAGLESLSLTSAAGTRDTYIRRPDLGRVLGDGQAEALAPSRSRRCGHRTGRRALCTRRQPHGPGLCHRPRVSFDRCGAFGTARSSWRIRPASPSAIPSPRRCARKRWSWRWVNAPACPLPTVLASTSRTLPASAYPRQCAQLPVEHPRRRDGRGNGGGPDDGADPSDARDRQKRRGTQPGHCSAAHYRSVRAAQPRRKGRAHPSPDHHRRCLLRNRG